MLRDDFNYPALGKIDNRLEHAIKTKPPADRRGVAAAPRDKRYLPPYATLFFARSCQDFDDKSHEKYRYNYRMSTKSRRKRKRAQALARGDRCNPSAQRTGKGVLLDWSNATVTDLIHLQRAISKRRVGPDDKGRRILELVLKIFEDPSSTPGRRIEAFRAIVVATGRADMHGLRDVLSDYATASKSDG